jgi:hypothetical protein
MENTKSEAMYLNTVKSSIHLALDFGGMLQWILTRHMRDSSLANCLEEFH